MTGILALLGFGSAAPLAASVTPFMSSSGGTTATFTTPSVSAAVTGGSGTYSYFWSIILTDGSHGFTALFPTAAVTTFSITSIAAGDGCFATARLTVTDAISGGSATVDVEISHRDTREAA